MDDTEDREAFAHELAASDIGDNTSVIEQRILLCSFGPDPVTAVEEEVLVVYNVLSRPQTQGEGWRVRKTYWSIDRSVQFLHVHLSHGAYIPTSYFFDVYLA